MSDSRLSEVAARLTAEHGGVARIEPLPGEDRWEVAAIELRPEFDGTPQAGPTCLASEIVHSDGRDAMLSPGTRIRHRRHPELTGRVTRIERTTGGRPSGIPYYVQWDDDGRASDLLGWFYIYATDFGIEAT